MTTAARGESVAEAAYRRRVARYGVDFAGYAADVLRAALTPDQAAVPGLLAAPPFRVLVPSANKVGKTFGAACLLNHFHDAHDPGICLATSATYRSLRTQLFKEVRRLRPFKLGLKPRAPEVYHHDQHQVVGFSTKNPDSFQGQHEGHWLLVMDEATAIPTEIADRAETMFSGVPGHGWVAFYNPNDPTTWPYAAEQSGGWAVRRLSALDHPNVAAELRGEEPPYPGAVRLHRIRQRIEKECEDCGGTRADADCFQFPDADGRVRWWKPVKPEFNPQVRGLWPTQATHVIWGDGDKRRCEQRVTPRPDWGQVQIGCDMSRGITAGNRTTFAVRHGTALVHLEARTTWPTRRASYHAAERLRELCWQYAPLAGLKPQQVPCLIDDSGGYGSGVVDYPEGHWFVRVVASEQARDPARFPNKRSELWLNAKLAADESGFFTGNCREGAELVPELWQELTAARYSLDKRGRLVAEGKDAVSARLGRSPDLADCTNLAWYPLGA